MKSGERTFSVYALLFGGGMLCTVGMWIVVGVPLMLGGFYLMVNYGASDE